MYIGLVGCPESLRSKTAEVSSLHSYRKSAPPLTLIVSPSILTSTSINIRDVVQGTLATNQGVLEFLPRDPLNVCPRIALKVLLNSDQLVTLYSKTFVQ